MSCLRSFRSTGCEKESYIDQAITSIYDLTVGKIQPASLIRNLQKPS